MTESKRGGARPGAGRPATGRNIEYITLTLPKELAKKVRTEAKKKGITLSAYFIESLSRFENMPDEAPKAYKQD